MISKVKSFKKMNRMINEHSITSKEWEKNKKKKEMMLFNMYPYGYYLTAWDFCPCEIKPRQEKKTVNSTEGLFFSINNSFWHIGEEVKLDIPEEHNLQWRMTRNNEEILPQTLSPAEWRHKSTKKKLGSCWISDLSREITFLFIFNKYLLQSCIKNHL